MAERLTSLPTIEAEVWAELDRASADKQHPWRTPVLATTDGSLGDARTVVLREVDTAQHRLLVFTDERAAKVAQLLSHPSGTLVMWSASRGWQLRCRVQLSVQPSGLATSSRWAHIKLSPAAHDYLSPLPPGTPLPALAPTRTTPPEREYFSVINAEVTSIDWLELHADGHRRALLCGDSSQWLQP